MLKPSSFDTGLGFRVQSLGFGVQGTTGTIEVLGTLGAILSESP